MVPPFCFDPPSDGSTPPVTFPFPLHVARREAAAWATDALFGRVLLLLCLIVLVPVFSVRVPPLNDYINHLARMHVIADSGADPFLSVFYSVEWRLIPNLAMDLIVPPLARLVGVYAAGQIFVAATVLLLATGPIAIHYALHRRFDLWALAGFLFLYNQVFIVGLMNYLAGVGLAMWGLAAWIVLRRRGLAVRLVVSALVVAATFLCHLSALGLYGLAIGAYELFAWRRRGWRIDGDLVRDGVALVLPALPVVPLLLGSDTWGLAAEVEWSAQGKLDAITMIFRTYADLLDLGILALLAASLVWAVQRSLISVHPAAWFLLGIGTLAFLAMPTMLFGSYMADQRLPIALFLMLLGFGRLNTRDETVRLGFVLLVVAFTAIRIGDLTLHWRHFAQPHAEFREALQKIDRGKILLVAYADAPTLTEAEQNAISHMASAILIERSGVASTEFTVPGKQILRIAPAFADRVDTQDGTPPNIGQVVASRWIDSGDEDAYWHGWSEKHDYLLVLHGGPDEANPDPDRLFLIHEGTGFQLYQILRDDP